jgi:hypothetical protein
MSTRGLLGAGKFAAIGLAMAAAAAMPLSASARGWGGGHGYHGGNSYSYRGGSHGGYHGGYYRHGGGHWEGGRWIAGAIVTGAVVGLIADALQPAPVYYDRPVVYGPPPTVIYEQAPPVTRRVVTRTVVYDDGYPTQYIRDDGYDRDDGN